MVHIVEIWTSLATRLDSSRWVRTTDTAQRINYWQRHCAVLCSTARSVYASGDRFSGTIGTERWYHLAEKSIDEESVTPRAKRRKLMNYSADARAGSCGRTTDRAGPPWLWSRSQFVRTASFYGAVRPSRTLQSSRVESVRLSGPQSGSSVGGREARRLPTPSPPLRSSTTGRQISRESRTVRYLTVTWRVRAAHASSSSSRSRQRHTGPGRWLPSTLRTIYIYIYIYILSGRQASVVPELRGSSLARTTDQQMRFSTTSL